MDELDKELAYDEGHGEYFEIGTLGMFTVDEISHSKDEIYATLVLDGNPTKLKVDTGAKCHVMMRSMLRKMMTSSNVDTTHRVRLVAYSGDSFITEGTITLRCHDKHGKEHPVQFHVHCNLS